MITTNKIIIVPSISSKSLSVNLIGLLLCINTVRYPVRNKDSNIYIVKYN